nr:apolipoprotein N-acyltransferase [Salinimonas marina]
MSAALLLLSGASLTLAYAPFLLWPVSLLGLMVAVRQLHRRPDQGFKTGWLFGLGWFGAGISWVHVSIADFGGLPLAASIGLMVVLCSYLALYPALAFYLTKRLFKPALWPLALPAWWFIGEWLRSWVLTGFPWLSVGYSQLNSPLAGWFPVIGETGVSALLIFVATGCAVWLTKRRFVPALLSLALVFGSGWALQHVQWVTIHKTVDVAMVQGNIEQSVRWQPEQDQPIMNTYRSLTQPLLNNDLIIWPEAAIPKLEYLSRAWLRELDSEAAQQQTAIISGIVNYNFESQQTWNSLIVLGQQDKESGGDYRYAGTNRYEKHHLLPIGEFVPFEDILRPLAPLFDLPMSSFTRGDYQQTNLLANGLRLAPAICFEIAFPRQVATNILNNTDILLTVSNDAWFGHSHGPAQHLQIAQTRALEMGKPVIRATNNGITAFIDANGVITSRLPQFQQGAIADQVDITRGMTPYRYAGDLPMALLLMVALIGGYWAQQRRQ